MQPQHRILFERIALGKLELDNRLSLAPTYVGAGDNRGHVTDQSLCYYFARAAGGLGLVVVEATGVTGRYAFGENYGLALPADSYIPGMRDLAQVIHWGGAKAILQLVTGMGAQGLSHHEKRPLVAPSDVPALIQQEDLPKTLAGLKKLTAEAPRPLSLDEIAYLKRATVKAAVRAKKAGFDGVEIHGAHGYILCQFASPYFNRRDDEYGGTPEKRRRLTLEIIDETKAAVGKDFVVGFRYSMREWIPGGLDFPESLALAKAVVEAGADYLSVSQGCYGTITHIFPRSEGGMVEDAAQVRKSVSVPVICPNFLDPDLAAKAVEDGAADLVALSRPLLADPEWPKKVREGLGATIQKCIRCNQCVRAINVEVLPVRCSVNPRLGFERFDPEYRPRPM